jgi:uncharacterized protein (TIGR02145 family)
MKKIFYFLFCLTSAAVSAQAPQGIPYQAIARNASGVAIANTAVKVRFSIRDSIATGAIKYQETHNPTTSALGLFSVNVGMGTVISGTFSGINWGKNAKFLQVELNTTGGTTYTDLGTTQMMSVPYALHSNTSDAIKMRTSATGDTLYTGGGNFLIIPGLSASNPTPPILNQPDAPITDIDGNVYQTVRIGTQVWMKENLKVSRYRNGEAIPNLTGGPWSGVAYGAFSNYYSDANNNNIYGKLYNWFTVVDTRGLCPNGWHVPSDTEWYVLENFLDPSINNPNAFGWIGTDISGKMKALTQWTSPNTGATNSSGFSGLPGSYRDNGGPIFLNLIGIQGQWWSTTEQSPTAGWNRRFDYNRTQNYRGANLKQDGYNIRCLKN